MTAVFETERLVLRVPSAEHSKEIASFYAANRDHLKPWSPTMAGSSAASPSPTSSEDHLQGCFFGYALAADAQSNGYMLEAVRGTVAHAFGPLRLHRVMANYMPRSRRSGAVLRRAGFAVEGYACGYLLIDGHWEDHLLTSKTNPDWNR